MFSFYCNTPGPAHFLFDIPTMAIVAHCTEQAVTISWISEEIIEMHLLLFWRQLICTKKNISKKNIEVMIYYINIRLLRFCHKGIIHKI